MMRPVVAIETFSGSGKNRSAALAETARRNRVALHTIRFIAGIILLAAAR
jgi:cytochrome c biogenesis protein CcdA